MIRYDAAHSDSHGEQVGLQRVREWAEHAYAAEDLGIYNYRPVRGGSSLSTHAEGRAWDARFPTGQALAGAIASILDHAEALQIQEIIDYRGGRRWSAPSETWERYDKAGAAGWTWHVARNWQGARDARSIEEVTDMVTADDVNAIALKTGAVVEAVMTPVVRRLVHEEIEAAFWGDGPDPTKTSERVPGGLIRRLRSWLRGQP